MHSPKSKHATEHVSVFEKALAVHTCSGLALILSLTTKFDVEVPSRENGVSAQHLLLERQSRQHKSAALRGMLLG
jgi:hypothetical protein